MLWLENLPEDWWNQYSSISLSSQCIQEVNNELLFLTRSLIRETRTYARVCKRIRLTINDFQNALDARNIRRSINHRTHSRKTILTVSSLLDQTDHLSSKINEFKLTSHWLAIDGEQLIIPENPLPDFSQENSFDTKQQTRQIISSELTDKSPLLQKLFEMASSTKTKTSKLQDHVHPLTKNNLIVKPNHPRNISIRRSHTNTIIPSSSIQPCLAHELSMEQQLYFKSLTESCFNGTDKQRSDAFHCFSSDASLQPLLPRLLLFLAKGIQTNIHLHDLNFILQFFSILKMLTMNRFLSFEKYLHSIIPTLLTCLVCLFDMTKPNHILSTINNYSMIWLIREQASDLILYFQRQYSTISHLTERIMSIIKSNLMMNNTTNTFSIVYGCLRTLLWIDRQINRSFVNDILQNYKQTKVLEPDFDLDHIEQQTIFDEKIREICK